MISLFHIGISVADITNFIRVFEENFGFTLVSRRTVDHEYIGALIGAPGASADIAMLDFGDGKLLELISWSCVSDDFEMPTHPNLSTKGTHHICVYVDSADTFFEKLSKVSEVKLVSSSPIVVPLGPNEGCKVFFALVLGTIYVEVFERVRK